MGLELGMREWMLLAGVALVVVILLDAIRRALKQRAENERLMRAKKSARQEPQAEFGWLKELPNGGARVVYRADDGVDGDEEAQCYANENHDATKPRGAVEESQDQSSRIDTSSATEAAAGVGGESEEGMASESVQELSVSSSNSSESSSPQVTEHLAPPGQTVDWLEALDTEEDTVSGAQDLIDNTPPEHVFLIHLKADDGKPYQGDTLLQLLLACDLRFGDLGFFHRHEQSGGRGPIQFSVANLLKPGVFDIDEMSSLQTSGVVFFMRVPGPKDLLTAYEAMLETARAVVQHLGGALLDHSHSVLTKQAIEHDKTLLREYARKQLLQKRS